MSDNDGLNVMIEQNSNERVLETRDNDDVICKAVLLACHRLQANPQCLLCVSREGINDQHLEVRSFRSTGFVPRIFVRSFLHLFVIKPLFEHCQMERSRSKGFIRQSSNNRTNQLHKSTFVALDKKLLQVGEGMPIGK